MLTIKLNHIAPLVTLLMLFGCGQKEEQKSKIEEAVKEAVTKEFKMYEGAKAALEKVEKKDQERREKEAEAK